MLSSRSFSAHTRASEEWPIELMLEAVRQKNEEKFKEASQLVCPNVYNKQHNGPLITVFAAENDPESVDFLLNSGGSFGWAIWSFAKHGHSARAYEYLKKGIQKYPDQAVALLSKMMEGFILGKRHGDANELLIDMQAKKYSDEDISKVKQVRICNLFAIGKQKEGYQLLHNMRDKKLRRELLDQIGEVLALHRSQIAVDNLLRVVKRSCPSRVVSVLSSIAGGFALRGFTENVLKVLNEIEIETQGNEEEIAVAMCGILNCFGIVGNTEHIHAYLEIAREKCPHFFPEMLGQVALGLATGGHKAKVFQLFAAVKNKSIEETLSVLNGMVLGFILNECEEEAYQVLKIMQAEGYAPKIVKTVLKKIASELVDGERIEGLNTLLEYVQKEHKKHFVSLLEVIADRQNPQDKLMNNAGVFKHLAFVEDAAIRENLLRKLINVHELKAKTTAAKEQEIQSILLKITRVHALMKDRGLSYAEARGWAESDLRNFLLVIDEKPEAADCFQTSVSKFLAPVPMKESEVQNLSAKLALQFFQSPRPTPPDVDVKNIVKRCREESGNAEASLKIKKTEQRLSL